MSAQTFETKKRGLGGLKSESQIEESRSSDEDSDFKLRRRRRRRLFEKRLPIKQTVTPTHWSSSVTLQKNRHGDELCLFRLFRDNDVGFREQDANCLTEIRQDDDVETDEEIFDNALRKCSLDCNEARSKLDRSPIN